MPSLPHPDQRTLFPLDKRCSKCGETKPLESFHRSNGSKDGRQGWCKACRCPLSPWLVQRQALRDAGLWQCTVCKNIKPRSEFHANHRGQSDIRSECRICENRRQVSDRLLHGARLRERDRAYRAANLDHVRAVARARRASDPATYRAQARTRYAETREHKLALWATWRQSHPTRVLSIRQRYSIGHRHMINIANHRYNVRLRLNGGSHTASQWLTLCERYGKRCLACNATGIVLTEDHVIPVSKGGTDDISNIQPLCRPCNARKGNRSATDYR